AYHARRARILPLEDEAFVAALARSTRDLWVVAAADPGRSLTLRNVRTGIEEYIAEGRGVVDAAVGKHVIARVAELPSGPRVYGMVYTVPEEEVGVVLSMLEEGMDSWDLAEWFAAGSTGPRGFSNTSGEAIVFCSVGVRLPDPGAAAATLDLSFQKSGDGAWLLIRDTEMMESAIVGSLKIEGELLVFSANSLERFAEVSGEVQRLFGNLEIVSQEFKTLAEAMAERDEPDEPAGSAVALDDPAIQAMMQEVMRKAEVRWLDESLPALRGRTPRQAVADPVLRKELESLLDRFERDEALIPKGTAAFSAARLRVLLGL
nr:hypothetical protein [Actinomycetota bacterium]